MVIHEQDYIKATSRIAETRRPLSGSIGSLLSTHAATGPMQVLAEMEEVVDYKQAVTMVATDLEAAKSNIILGRPEHSAQHQHAARGRYSSVPRGG